MLKKDFFDLFRGMDQSIPRHLPKEGTFWFSYNFRFRPQGVVQTRPLKSVFEIVSGDSKFFTAYAAYVSEAYSSLLVALGQDGLYVLDFPLETATFVTQPLGFNEDTQHVARWAHVTTSVGLYYVNPLNQLMVFDGNTCANAITTGPAYYGKYLVEYRGHLVLANVSESGNAHPLRIAYSDKDDYADWEPTTTNEADYFDLDNTTNNALYGLGITGLVKLNDVCLIFTAGSIWQMRYVGFDAGVMQFTQLVDGIGNWLPYSVISVDKVCMFIAADNIYVFDGISLTAKGDAIKEYFYADLTTDPALRVLAFASIDIVNEEVRWFYPNTSATNGHCNACIVYNWRTDVWYAESGFNISAVLNAGTRTYRTIDGLSGLVSTIDGLASVSATIDGLAEYSLLPETVYLRSDSNNVWYETGSNDVVDRIDVVNATLETRGILFNPIGDITEIQALFTDADFVVVDGMDANAFDVISGIKVSVNLGRSVALLNANDFATLDFLKSSTFTSVSVRPYNKIQGGARASGTWFTFKFETINVYNTNFYGFYVELGAKPSAK